MTWMIAAYTIIWVALFAFFFSLDRRQKALSKELAQIKSKLGS
jgi:CcmD family protein